MLIKPTESGLHTNLIVTTNRRTYYVTLVSRSSNPAARRS
ncbi:MAG: TrbG/VirB9 family P-type conjugative transfer protein [bacterium]|nr:TrbG/VirB9 family P-type conjugative transfer protein [bacterium]